MCIADIELNVDPTQFQQEKPFLQRQYGTQNGMSSLYVESAKILF
jgi:hypothetical protein